MKKILFIVQSPNGISPSQRFRLELYEKILRENNFDFAIQSFIDRSTRKIIYQEGYVFQKVFGVIKGFVRRFTSLAGVSKYDFIVVYREASPIGPPIFEWIYTKIFRKKLIFDFDDAIWVPQISDNNKLAGLIKCSWKIKFICRWSYKVSVGNMFLYNYAIRYNQNVVLNPTCVDTEFRHNILKSQETGKATIGWTGSFSTLVYLNQVIEVLQALEKKYAFNFIVIADKNPLLPLKGFTFLKWNKQTEITDLLQINIGIMPLPDTEFERGKCGFKLIQFLALGIPAVASPVGVNKDIIEEENNGFLCKTEEEWYIALEKLLCNQALREKMGLAGREKVEKNYSTRSNAANFLSLFK
jgi:glycosyltransferase involved in cell wall biosynthesis